MTVCRQPSEMFQSYQVLMIERRGYVKQSIERIGCIVAAAKQAKGCYLLSVNAVF